MLLSHEIPRNGAHNMR